MLFVFGDSWPAGAELDITERPFPEILAQGLRKQLRCLAVPSSSIPHLVLQLQNAVNDIQQCQITDSIGVFFLSSPDRDMIWSAQARKCDGRPYAPGQFLPIHLNPNNPEDREWFCNIHSLELADYRVNVTLLALQKICQEHNIRDYYVWGWEKVQLWPEIDRDRFYKNGQHTLMESFVDPADEPVTLLDLSKSRNPYLWPNQSHPNQLGHELIAKILLEWIKHN